MSWTGGLGLSPFLCDSLSLLYYIDNSDRERERVEIVEITEIREYISVESVWLFVLCCLIVGYNRDKWQEKKKRKKKVKLRKIFVNSAEQIYSVGSEIGLVD